MSKCIVVLSSLLLLVTANADELPRSGTFEGQWTVVGETQEIEFADDRRIHIVRHKGNVNFESSGGLPRAMFSDCLGFGDSKTGGLTRCKWVDTDGEHIYSELTVEVFGASGTIRGRFVGGTGKYQGLQGELEFFAWIYEATIQEEGTIHGYTDTLRGEWRFP